MGNSNPFPPSYYNLEDEKGFFSQSYGERNNSPLLNREPQGALSHKPGALIPWDPESTKRKQLKTPGLMTGNGADAVEAQCKRFEVRARDGGKVLFSADEDEIVIGADRLKVTGMIVLVPRIEFSILKMPEHNVLEEDLNNRKGCLTCG
ncbi:hypothetical protein DUI87_09161 [Hirundo rustica rustica]|uniref:Uncharacterized protein n=1 Tax=Hirundo rustica rustica TaxID=333673 RepID=A0A3M0KM04_HIRRU|nr:hypothetical protein DUI87_09161 [Hirundo rustica rustica]